MKLRKIRKTISKSIAAVIMLSMAFSSLCFNTLTAYASDGVSSTRWNDNALDGVSSEIFEDFPVSINNQVDNFANLNITFHYLKNVTSADSVHFEIMDRNTGEEVNSFDFSGEQMTACLENIDMNRVFDLKITENFVGEETKIYEAVLETENVEANFPNNVSITENSEIAESDYLKQVMVSKVDESSESVFIDENENETIFANLSTPVSVNVTELPSYYETLEKNCLYRVQASATIEGLEETYEGFISTFPDGRNMGIYTPGYSFHLASDYNKVKTTRASVEPRVNHPMVSPSDIEAEGNIYHYMQDASFTLPYDDKDYFIIGFKFLETGSYTIETVGNVATSAEYWSKLPDGTWNYNSLILGNGGNFCRNTTILADEVRAFVVYFDRESSGRSVFRIKSNDYPNDTSNSIYDIETNNIKSQSNVVFDESIDYPRDVDAFYVDNAIKGQYGIKVENKSKSNNLTMVFCNRPSSNSILWTDATKEIRPGRSLTYVPNLNVTPIHYFVTIKENDKLNYADDYTLEIISPTKGDTYEPNNSFETATSFTTIGGDEGEINDLTLHKGDIDYFSFETGSGGADFYSWLNEVYDMEYNLELYKEVGNIRTKVDSGIKSDFDTVLEINDLLPSTKYYLCVNNTGMGTDAYTAVGHTTLSWEITNKAAPIVPSAVLNGNVAYNINEDDTVNDLNTLLGAVMSKMTCKENDVVVPSETAKSDVKLYYMNGTAKTELTAAILNNLSVGNYVLYAEYKGAAATGGTITLNVAAAIDKDIIQLQSISAETADYAELDWLYCARDMANIRLKNDGKALSTSTINDVAGFFGLDPDSFIVERKGLPETLKATYRFYTNGADEKGTAFAGMNNAALLTVEQVYDRVAKGQGTIIQMVDTTNRVDMMSAQYLLICGANKIEQKLLIKDPKNGTLAWVHRADLINGGYDPNNLNFKFSGGIIEKVV